MMKFVEKKYTLSISKALYNKASTDILNEIVAKNTKNTPAIGSLVRPSGKCAAPCIRVVRDMQLHNPTLVMHEKYRKSIFVAKTPLMFLGYRAYVAKDIPSLTFAAQIFLHPKEMLCLTYSMSLNAYSELSPDSSVAPYINFLDYLNMWVPAQ